MTAAHQHARARLPSLFSFLAECRKRDAKPRRAPTLVSRPETRDGLAAHTDTHAGTVINRGLSIAGGVLMEAEICDLDELGSLDDSASDF